MIKDFAQVICLIAIYIVGGAGSLLTVWSLLAWDLSSALNYAGIWGFSLVAIGLLILHFTKCAEEVRGRRY